jgi:hypothetical protein
MLFNLKPYNVAVTDADIPTGIARDAEVTAVMDAHLAATDPHGQYLLQNEGDARYRLTSTLLTDADIPTGIARDAEVTAVMDAHLAATDPHGQYLLQNEGDARYRLTSTLLTDADIPTGIARDAEVTAVMNAHLAATDPHGQYLLPSEGDARYLRALTTTFSLDLPNMAPNSLEKRFYTLAGAKVGDLALLVPINANLFANASWPFLFAAVVEVTDTVACYFRNDNTTTVDLAGMQFRIVVILF